MSFFAATPSQATIAPIQALVQATTEYYHRLYQTVYTDRFMQEGKMSEDELSVYVDWVFPQHIFDELSPELKTQVVSRRMEVMQEPQKHKVVFPALVNENLAYLKETSRLLTAATTQADIDYICFRLFLDMKWQVDGTITSPGASTYSKDYITHVTLPSVKAITMYQLKAEILEQLTQFSSANYTHARDELSGINLSTMRRQELFLEYGRRNNALRCSIALYSDMQSTYERMSNGKFNRRPSLQPWLSKMKAYLDDPEIKENIRLSKEVLNSPDGKLTKLQFAAGQAKQGNGFQAVWTDYKKFTQMRSYSAMAEQVIKNAESVLSNARKVEKTLKARDKRKRKKKHIRSQKLTQATPKATVVAVAEHPAQDDAPELKEEKVQESSKTLALLKHSIPLPIREDAVGIDEEKQKTTLSEPCRPNIEIDPSLNINFRKLDNVGHVYNRLFRTPVFSARETDCRLSFNEIKKFIEALGGRIEPTKSGSHIKIFLPKCVAEQTENRFTISLALVASGGSARQHGGSHKEKTLNPEYLKHYHAAFEKAGWTPENMGTLIASQRPISAPQLSF